jgi:transketolase
MGEATRDAFGTALKELGGDFPKVVVVDGDVGNSTRTEVFAKAFPERAFNVGIAESNMVGVAGGLAAAGKIPVVSSFAVFLMANAYDQIRMSVAYPALNVKLVGSHAGISIGEDGASQMGIEDVALACSLPGMTVIVPADATSARLATKAMLEPGRSIFAAAALKCRRSTAPIRSSRSARRIGCATART